MRFRKTIDTVAEQYLVGKPLPPGVVKDNGLVYFIYQGIGPPLPVRIPLKGGEWISTYHGILDLEEWKQVDFKIKVNGVLLTVDRPRLRTDELCAIAGKRAVREIQVILREHWAGRVRTTQWEMMPGEFLEMAEDLEVHLR